MTDQERKSNKKHAEVRKSLQRVKKKLQQDSELIPKKCLKKSVPTLLRKQKTVAVGAARRIAKR